MKKTLLVIAVLSALVMGVSSAQEMLGSGEGQQAQIKNLTEETKELREEAKNQTQEMKEEAQQIREELRNQSPEDALRNQTREEIKNQTQEMKETAEQIRNETKTQTKNLTQEIKQIREEIRNQSRILNQSSQGLGPEKEKIYQNQNEVRLAVHTMLALENLSGGIGKNISAVAKEFNNSVQATIQAEERIQERAGLMRFFFGGDEKAAGELERVLNQNRVRIEQLTQYMNECDCEPEVKALLQEQLQQMTAEQERLRELATQEKNDKGLLGWLIK